MASQTRKNIFLQSLGPGTKFAHSFMAYKTLSGSRLESGGTKELSAILTKASYFARDEYVNRSLAAP
jgi:hypothetical protein